jgi:hypothetical protein
MTDFWGGLKDVQKKVKLRGECSYEKSKINFPKINIDFLTVSTDCCLL